jgi:LacI family transcriptional regulator
VTTIRDVAERAQVSTATVSRVLNGKASVNPIIRRAVLKAVDELQFQPNAVARTLRTARTRTLALLVSGMRNGDLLSSVLLGAETVANDNGYALFVGNTRRDPGIERQYLKSLAERRVDGILCASMLPLDEIQGFGERTGIPVVVYGRDEPIDLVPHTVLRFTRATEEAIEHLIALGHRRIATVTHVSESGLAPRFGWGASFIRQALAVRGIATCAEHHLIVESEQECAGAVQAMLTTGQRPTAVFITNLFLAPATLAGVKSAGAHVPADVSLIGCGDSGWAAFVEPPLSVVAADLSALLTDSARMLINLINHNNDLPVSIEHRARYIRRASVQPPAECSGHPAALHDGADAREPHR